ncbi:HEAT repeat-containing protein 6-like [Bolinopsis microptera]|uniref:HEAT repeat-containing protein 6-like n=1 Tax=Bolinopsis microptera TaxID=2820187 RepID=UPI0030797346
MDGWSKATKLDQHTSKSELSLTLQGLLFELHSGNLNTTNPVEVKAGLLNIFKQCGDETKLQIKWCQLAVLSLNATQCVFTTQELNNCATFIIDVCRAANYLYCTVEALGALLYNTDLNTLRTLDVLLGERGMMLELSLGLAPEREVQHLALRCLNNMLNSVTDEMFVTHIVSTLTTLATARLHGDNLNRARLLSGVMKCLQTIAKHNTSQYLLEQILSIVKGSIFEGASQSTSPAISLESLSLDELNLSDVNEPGHTRYSQPRVRNKKGRGKRKKQDARDSPKPRIDHQNDSNKGRKRAEQETSWRTPRRKQAPNNQAPNKAQNSPQIERPSPKQHHPAAPPPTQPAASPAVVPPMDKNTAFNPQRQTDFSVSTSESEYSESDTEEGIQNKVTAVKCRTRLTSLQTLQHCISCVHKSRTFSVWSAFLPQDPTAGLLNVIQKEPNVKCRIAGLGALSSLIESVKHYFVAADSRPSKGRAAYTPFSQSLATDLLTLHSELLLQIPGCVPAVLPHLFQCLAVLVIHTPFSKLKPGLVSSILTESMKHLSSVGHYKVEAAALSLLCACLTVETPLPEVGSWLGANEQTVGMCLEHLRKTTHQRDTLQTLCQILRFYFTPVIHWWPQITDAAKLTLASSVDTLIQNMSLLVLEELGRALSGALEAGTLELSTLKEHWINILSSAIVPILQNEHSPIMPGACDILSTIGNTVFASFEVHTQRLIMTLLLALTNPTVPATSSACRCLGVLVMYPCIRDDLLFVADTANAIITALETTDSADSGLLLRVSWSLGNLSDTLVVNKLNNPSFVTDFSDILLGRLLDVSLKTAASNDKVKSNIVRALGNLLRFMKQSTHSKAHFREYVARSVDCLLRACTSGMMKTRWNACYALVNTLQNPVLSPADSTWGTDLFTTLTSVVVHCKNYKVRINATLALAQCLTRACYGGNFVMVWGTVLVTLSEEGGGPAMCGYTERLRFQLVLLLCHLVVIHLEEDHREMFRHLPHPHQHGALISQCSAVSTSEKLTTLEQDLVTAARVKCQQYSPALDLVLHMLTPTPLPSDSDAFITSDISSNTK